MKKIIIAFSVLLLTLFTIFAFNIKNVSADELPSEAITDYENANRYSNTWWVIKKEDIYTLEFYTNSSYNVSGTFYYITQYNFNVVSASFTTAPYSQSNMYLNGCNYYPYGVYLSNYQSGGTYSVNYYPFDTYSFSGVILHFNNINLTSASDNHIYMKDFDYFSSVNLLCSSYNQAIYNLFALDYEANSMNNDVLNNPNNYDLYTSQQYLDYGYEQFNIGKQEGIESANTYTFKNLFVSVFDAPVQMIFGARDNDPASASYGQRVGGLLNFEILGTNMSTFLTGLLTVCLFIGIIKIFI